MIYTNFNIGKYILTFILYVLASLLLFSNPETLINVIIYITSFFMIMSSIVKISYYSKLYEATKTNKIKFELIFNALIFITAILLLFFPGTLFFMLIGTLMIINPVIKIISTKNKDEIIKNIIMILIALFLISLGLESIMSIIFKVFGIIFLISAIANTISIIKLNKERDKEFEAFFRQENAHNSNNIGNFIDGEILEERSED